MQRVDVLELEPEIRKVACQAQKQPAGELRHIEHGLDSLMVRPWCRSSHASEALGLLLVLGKLPDIVPESLFTAVFDKPGRDYSV